MSTALPRVLALTGARKTVSFIAMLLMCAAGSYPLVVESDRLYRAGGVMLALFGVAGFVDTLVSRIILEEDRLRIISLVRRRNYSRSEFESAKVDGGAVALKKRSGGWLLLPDTGGNALSVRNTMHAWIKSGAVDGQEE